VTHPAARQLRQIRGERFFQVFDDWLELSLAAFCRDEDRYMATMKRYGPRENGKEHPRRTILLGRSAQSSSRW